MNSSRASHEINGLPHCLVDGFKHRMPDIAYQDRCYFLTHYHSDHYGGLASYWKHGKIYCSNTTANLICNIMEVNPNTVQRVTVGETIRIKGARVTFMDANHCPGAVILLFELDSGLNHLHTGDLRYCPAMKLYPALQNVKIDRLYLDTTYAHPKHTFMAQDESIAKIVNLAKEFIAQNPEDGIIFISAYNLGKERVIFALADAVNLAVYMDADKIKIISQIEGGLERVQSGRFTSDPHAARIHVCSMGFLGSLFPYFKPNFASVRQHVVELNSCSAEAGVMKHFLHSKHSNMPMILPAPADSKADSTSEAIQPMTINRVIAFIPTGWADNGNFNKQHSIMSEEEITVCTVPYSEHSNYTELMEFVTFLKPREVIPTVYSDEKNRLFILDLFRNSVDRISNMRNFIAKLGSPAPIAVHSSTCATGALAGSSSVGCNSRTVGVSRSSSLGAAGNRVSTLVQGTLDRSVTIDLCDSDGDGDVQVDYTHTSARTAMAVKNDVGDRSDGALKKPRLYELTVLSGSSNSQLIHSNNSNVLSGGASGSSGSSGGGGTGDWSCSVCTYRHTESGNELFLQCVLCCSPRHS